MKFLYLVLKPVQTWNPVHINFIHLAQIIKDAWHTTSFFDKLRIWVMPTGWRPTDVALKYPISYPSDPHQQIKYFTKAPTILHAWLWFNLVITLVLTLHLFSNLGNYSFTLLLLYALFILLTVYSYTSLMDGDKKTFVVDILRLALVSVINVKIGSWYGLSVYIFIIWIVISLSLSYYFIRNKLLDFSILTESI